MRVLGKVKNKQNNKQLKQHLVPLENKLTVTLDIQEIVDTQLHNIENKKCQYTIPIFIPHLGCQNACVFCNQRKISGVLSVITPQQVEEKIQEYLSYFSNKRADTAIEIAFFGGSFTGLKVAEQIAYLTVANRYVETGEVDSIRISTRPDYITPAILSRLAMYHVRTIELGVQSMDDRVLTLSKRGHLQKEVKRASRLITLFGFALGHQMMIGLPGSNVNNELKTIEQILRLHPVCLRIYPVYVIENSELYEMYVSGKYQPLTVEEAVKRCIPIVQACQKTEVSIIRFGLQATDEITKNNQAIVGPVCDNFAEYVYAYLLREKIQQQLQTYIEVNKIGEDILQRGIQLQLLCDSKYTSMIIGPKRINAIYFEEQYHAKIKIKEKEN